MEVRFHLSSDGPLAGPMEVTASARPWNDRHALVGGDAFFDRMADCQTDAPEGSRFADFLDRSVIATYVEEEWPVERMLDEEVRTVWNVTADGSVELFGDCTPTTFVDGALTSLPAPLSHFTPEEIEAVEVHTRPHVPRRYWVTASQPCGVVALWTRRTSLDSGSSTNPKRVLLGVGTVLTLIYLLR